MRKKIILYVSLIILSVSLFNGCMNNENNSESVEIQALKEDKNGIDMNIQSKILNYINSYSKDSEFSGAILVTQGGDIIFDRGFGMADYDNNIKNTPQTVFEIASLTKQFTATAILMLQEKGLLSVQDPLSKYIPDYPSGDKIKIYNLLNHSSGIHDYVESAKAMESEKNTFTLEELIELFKNDPLDFEPGTEFGYSNSNYILLGYIIEKLSNMKYEDYIEENILKPLNLNDTGFLSSKADIKNKAIGYSVIDTENNEYEKAIDKEGPIIASAGEIYSTVEDLYRWEEALFSERIINRTSLNEMFTPGITSYGYGWSIDESVEGNKVVSHVGNLPGYTAYIGRNLYKKYSIIILSNRDDDPYVSYLYEGILKILGDE